MRSALRKLCEQLNRRIKLKVRKNNYKECVDKINQMLCVLIKITM